MRNMASKSFCLSLICIWLFSMDCNAFQAHTLIGHRTTKSQPSNIFSLGPPPLGPLSYPTHLTASDQDFEPTNDSNLPSLWLFAGIPLLSLTLPFAITSQTHWTAGCGKTCLFIHLGCYSVSHCQYKRHFRFAIFGKTFNRLDPISLAHGRRRYVQSE
jgi:hypothetical protein